jgi:hypothetical protein
MIFTSFTVCRDFSICLGHSTGPGSFYQPNVGEMACNIFVYGFQSTANANGRPLKAGGNDLTEFVGGPINYEFTESVTWAVINVTDGNKSKCELLEFGEQEINGGDNKYIAVIDGEILVNEKKITELKYARIREGKTVNVAVPSNAVVVVVSVEK